MIDTNAMEISALKLAAGHLVADLNQMADLDLLLEGVLTNSIALVRAEAGSIYLIQNGVLIFARSQNAYLERTVHSVSELPFQKYSLPLDRTTLAGYVAMEHRPLTINNINDIPAEAPFQHDSKIDNHTNYSSRAIMTLPLKSQGHDFLGILQLINPLDESGLVTSFREGDEELMSFFARNVALALERAMMLRSMTLRNVNIISAHDPRETSAHAQRVAGIVSKLYEQWAINHGLSPQERFQVMNILPLAAMLHDIGKIRIPGEILTKPGRLDVAERKVMEEHVLAGARLFTLNQTPLDRLTLSVILDHHERWDGQGYPGWVDIESGKSLFGTADSTAIIGKRKDEISIYGRLTAVADVYDALSSRKTYKEPFDESLVLQIMKQESGHHFDPEVIEILSVNRQVLKSIRENFPDENLE